MKGDHENISATLLHHSLAEYLGVAVPTLSLLVLLLISPDSPLQFWLATILIVINSFAVSLYATGSHVSQKYFGSILAIAVALQNWFTAVNFGTSTLGSVELSKQSYAKRNSNQYSTGNSQSRIIARYRAPVWFSYRTWQFCCYGAGTGWMCHLVMYNVVPSISRQFRYAKRGSLSKLQNMIANKEASIFDQTEDGNTILSVSRTDTNKMNTFDSKKLSLSIHLQFIDCRAQWPC